MTSRDRSRSPMGLCTGNVAAMALCAGSKAAMRMASLPDSIQRRITRDAALMIIQEDFEKASLIAMAAADRSDLAQGMRSPRASDIPVSDEQRNAWQAHFYLGTADPSQAVVDRVQAKAAQLRRIQKGL